MKVLDWLVFITFTLSFLCGWSQEKQNPRIYIKGRVVSPDQPSGVSNLMVINQNLGFGNFGNPDGSFEFESSKNDTLIISALGYHNKRICFADSVLRKNYFVTIKLSKLHYELRPVEIIARRDLEKIYKDIEKLGYKKQDYMVSGIDAINSPITFLYENYSKRERSKRLVAQLENEDRKRDLLKELFSQYVHNNIIDLKNEEFDAFIDFCKVSDYFLKTTSQYDFIMFVKHKYQQYVASNDYSRNYEFKRNFNYQKIESDGR